jgi:AraC family transcriptional regulator
MAFATESAIERTIDIMWDRYSEPLSLEELADAAIFSKFYYSRVFRDLTGTSPGRFLSAIRLYMAKRHLLETHSSVTEISYRVGYNSLGTFTSRFTRSVGISPARYRFLAEYGLPPIIPFGQQGCPESPLSTLSGVLKVPEDYGPLRVYVGAFHTPIVEGLPQDCDILDASGPFSFKVPEGEWFVRAAAVSMRPGDRGLCPRIRTPLLIGASWPVTVSGGHDYTTSDVELRPYGPLDLPILLALPELDGGECTTVARAAR